MTAGGSRIARWVVLEPTLGKWIGHQRALFEALPAVARQRGSAIALYAGAAATEELRAATGAVALFRFRPLPRWTATGHGKALARFLQSSQEMLEGLRGTDGPVVGPSDVVLLPTAYPWVMLAVGSWLRHQAAETRPRVAAVVHEGAGLLVDAGSPVTADQAMLALGLGALDDMLPPDRWVLAATTPALAAAVGRQAGRPVGIVPVANPVDRFAPALPARDRRTPEGALRIGLPGAPRDGKRPDLTADIVMAVHRRLPDALVTAQVGRTAARPPDHPLLALHTGSLSDADYTASITGSAVVILPYDAARYRERVSGIFVECAAAGCVTVVPAGTWMADRIAAGEAAGMVFAGDDPDAVGDAAERAVGRLAELSDDAAARAPDWRAGHGPRAFIERIEALLAALPAGASP